MQVYHASITHTVISDYVAGIVLTNMDIADAGIADVAIADAAIACMDVTRAHTPLTSERPRPPDVVITDVGITDTVVITDSVVITVKSGAPIWPAATTAMQISLRLSSLMWSSLIQQSSLMWPRGQVGCVGHPTDMACINDGGSGYAMAPVGTATSVDDTRWVN
jgi:hypothetical protein